MAREERAKGWNEEGRRKPQEVGERLWLRQSYHWEGKGETGMRGRWKVRVQVCTGKKLGHRAGT